MRKSHWDSMDVKEKSEKEETGYADNICEKNWCGRELKIWQWLEKNIVLFVKFPFPRIISYKYGRVMYSSRFLFCQNNKIESKWRKKLGIFHELNANNNYKSWKSGWKNENSLERGYRSWAFGGLIWLKALM